MDDSMDMVDHHEPHAIRGLLFQSALLGLMTPVGLPLSEGVFWSVKAILVVSALVLCLLLYGLENTIHWLSQEMLHNKPSYAAAYRGGILYGLMTFAMHGDVFLTLGAIVGAYFIAMGVFKLEERYWKKEPQQSTRV